MSYLALVLVWMSGLVTGLVVAVGLRVYWELRAESGEAPDPHERVAWPVRGAGLHLMGAASGRQS